MLKGALVITLCAAALPAQTTQAGQASPVAKLASPAMVTTLDTFGPIGITGAVAGPTANIAGAPYSAKAETERVQILADGNRIEQTTSSLVARDSKGRVRRDETMPALEGDAADAPHLTFIEDPVAGVHWTLDSRTKTAMKMPFSLLRDGGKTAKLTKDTFNFTTTSVAPALPLPPSPGRAFAYSTTLPMADIQVEKLQADADAQLTKTDLGAQTVEGVPAQGTKMTRTIAAGKIGNSMPIVISTETWYSPDLKVLVMSKSSDPRMGETTYRLTGLQRAEPPATLFEIPSDYSVKEGPGNIVFRAVKPQE